MKRAVGFYTRLASVYLLTIGAIGYALYPAPIFHDQKYDTALAVSQRQIADTPKPTVTVISGKPVRVVVPDYGIDLPVDEGHYNEADGSWTLGDTHAYYAVMTNLANNTSGNTLIYGHGTDVVFGKLGAKVPEVGTIAEVYTDNGHVFRYAFTDARNLTPDDTSVLAEQATPATLTLQTCTGVFSEWRTMFRFTLVELVQ